MFWLKFLKTHISLTLLNSWRDSFAICIVVRYWSKVLLSTILTLLSDLDIKVMDLEYCFFLGWVFG